MRIRVAMIIMLIMALTGCGGGGGGGVQTPTPPSTTADTLAPVTTVSPAGGTYTAAQTVKLTASEAATIYYTLDGSTPTTSSPVYTSPLTISETKTIKFFAKDTAGNVEAVNAQSYVIDTTADPNTIPPVTTVSPAPGTYVDIQAVSLTASKEGATIYYTVDGSTPTVDSSVYDNKTPITVASSATIKYFAVDTYGNMEAVKSASYTINFNFFPMNPGTTWTYRDTSGNPVNRTVTNDGRITTTAAANPTRYDTYTILSDGAIALTRESVTTTSGTITSVYDPGAIVLPSSLVAGFSQASNYNLTVGSGSASAKTYTVTVHGRENVVVPAGTFNALRVDVVRLVDGSPAGSSSSWYVSGIGLVKDSSMELSSYHIQ